MSGLTLAMLDRLVALADEGAIKPRRITTKAMARRFRRQDAALGIDSKWRIGDEYYLLRELTGDRALYSSQVTRFFLAATPTPPAPPASAAELVSSPPVAGSSE